MKERSPLSHRRLNGPMAHSGLPRPESIRPGGPYGLASAFAPWNSMARVLDPILSPRSIAVIGASRSPNTMGHQILANLVRYGFTGAAFPVNPKATSVYALKAWPTVGAIP